MLIERFIRINSCHLRKITCVSLFPPLPAGFPHHYKFLALHIVGDSSCRGPPEINEQELLLRSITAKLQELPRTMFIVVAAMRRVSKWNFQEGASK